MEYRQLGQTGLKLSILGFGASGLGDVFGNIDESDGIRAVHTAIDLGINFIDVSPYYGLTKAERVLGTALKQIPRDAYYLATKVGRYGERDFDFSAARVIASVDESLKRLHVDYIDIIQCHDIEFGSLDQIINETIPALRDLQQTGKVRYVGISGLPLSVLHYVAQNSEIDTVLSYCHYTLNDTSMLKLIPYLKEWQIGVINASPFGMGLLTENKVPAWHPASAEIKAACAEAAQYCRSKGVAIAQLALQFSIANADITTTLVGITNPDQIKANVQCVGQALNQELLAEVQHILAPIRDVSWPSGREHDKEFQFTIYG
ncbi:MAG: aldo/keto reductase [Anaerolineae bacterium]|nr:aldo/keto reductase [Anaerolineae bacterium]